MKNKTFHAKANASVCRHLTRAKQLARGRTMRECCALGLPVAGALAVPMEGYFGTLPYSLFGGCARSRLVVVLAVVLEAALEVDKWLCWSGGISVRSHIQFSWGRGGHL